MKIWFPVPPLQKISTHSEMRPWQVNCWSTGSSSTPSVDQVWSFCIPIMARWHKRRWCTWLGGNMALKKARKWSFPMTLSSLDCGWTVPLNSTNFKARFLEILSTKWICWALKVVLLTSTPADNSQLETLITDEGLPPVHPHELLVARLAFQQPDPITDFCLQWWYLDTCNDRIHGGVETCDLPAFLYLRWKRIETIICSK